MYILFIKNVAATLRVRGGTGLAKLASFASLLQIILFKQLARFARQPRFIASFAMASFASPHLRTKGSVAPPSFPSLLLL